MQPRKKGFHQNKSQPVIAERCTDTKKQKTQVKIVYLVNRLEKYRPDSTSGKTFHSGAGYMGFKSQADQISHTLPTTRHRCNLDWVGIGAKPPKTAPLTRDTRKGIKRV